MAAEDVAMFGGADFHAAAFFFGPMNCAAPAAAMKGTKRGRLRRCVIRRQPAVILGRAKRDQFADIDVGAQLASAPLTVKLLSCWPLETSEAMPMRS